MIKRKPYHCLVALICAFCFFLGLGAAPPPVMAFSLGGLGGDIIKTAGIGFVVKQFGGQIDRFLNSVLSQKGIQREGMTKVVPVVRLGSGTAVGAVQVVGPELQVKKVKAVAEIELGLGDRIRGRALLPIEMDSFNVSTIHGVGGVGISANIKIPL